MAKKSQRTRKQSEKKDGKPQSQLNDPWLSKRTGLIVMVVISLALAGYIIWQLYPTEGLGSIWWGLGFAASIWVVFGIFYLFNVFVRGRR